MLSLRVSAHDNRFQVALTGELTIYTAAQAKQEIQSYIYAQDYLEIDLSEVSELDTAGVQLLLWLRHQAQAKNHHLAYVAFSPSVLEVMDLMNLNAIFGDSARVDVSNS